ncbi:hypothetical protein [Thioalkalivibrio paradoxus]|uniref:Type II secretion system protein GspC N-terminal domain-containing protein n=1 Tax=Thioalkalivibrio paradoxus ARh 1 TaxID=713585 RepID=W0DNU8_9GAMM|nr:hypothetical protein [Thioalkalivibrio paradoxus]AHF00137.1 hypothetical protein THITH_10165 [Thioalkalivibrio paradoxus ARh 1]
MRRLPPLSLLPLLLAGNLVVGGWLVVQIVASDVAWEPPAALAPAPPQFPDVRIPAAAPGGEVLARPPFWESRRPTQARPEARARDALSGIRVLGVLGSGRDGGILYADGDQVGRLTIGQELGGWRLIQVDRDTARFERRNDGEERELRLPRPGGEAANPGRPPSAGASSRRSLGAASGGSPAARARGRRTE